MEEKKVQVVVGGKTVDGLIINYETIKENWNEYKLDDGTLLKAKSILTQVVRTKKFDKQGNPIYHYTTSAIATVIVPDELKKK